MKSLITIILVAMNFTLKAQFTSVSSDQSLTIEVGLENGKPPYYYTWWLPDGSIKHTEKIVASKSGQYKWEVYDKAETKIEGVHNVILINEEPIYFGEKGQAIIKYNDLYFLVTFIKSCCGKEISSMVLYNKVPEFRTVKYIE